MWLQGDVVPVQGRGMGIKYLDCSLPILHSHLIGQTQEEAKNGGTAESSIDVSLTALRAGWNHVQTGYRA